MCVYILYVEFRSFPSMGLSKTPALSCAEEDKDAEGVLLRLAALAARVLAWKKGRYPGATEGA